MNKISVFQEFNDTTSKRMQIVYLKDYGFEVEEISKWTKYAASTIKSYARKFAYLLDEAKKRFYHITQKAKAEMLGGKQLVYLFKFYGDDDKLICSKVGTTTRLPETRLKEEIKYYCKHGIEVKDAKICSIIDCGKIPAEGAESAARAEFIKIYPTKFCKNDRFFGINISTRRFNEVITRYLGEPTLA